jgi:hypothetical protein
MVAIVTIEYFNKCAEEFIVDISEYKTFKHFAKSYRSFITRCNYDGAGTDLVFLSAYFKLHDYENESRAISTKNISQVYYELEDMDAEDYAEYDECCECDCQCEDEPDELDEIDDKLYFIDEKLDEILDRLDKKEKKEKKEEPKQTKKKVLLENK